jgi:hypothetical protein
MNITFEFIMASNDPATKLGEIQKWNFSLMKEILRPAEIRMVTMNFRQEKREFLFLEDICLTRLKTVKSITFLRRPYRPTARPFRVVK